MPLLRGRRRPRTTIPIRPGMQGRARRRPEPSQQMRARAAAIGPKKIVRISNFRRAATMERRSWGNTLLIGPLIEWVLNFVFRGRRFRTGAQRPSLKEPIAAVGAKSKARKLFEARQRKNAKELAQLRDVA